MSCPDFQSFFKPLLDVAADGNEHSIQEARDIIAKRLQLPEADMKELLPSGTQTKFENRIAWAKSYFIQAKVLEPTRRSHFKITQRGIDLHGKNLERIDVRTLKQYPEFVEFHEARGAREEITIPQTDAISETPEESIQRAYESIRNILAGQILDKVKSNSPAFFEKLVVDLMVAVGYGGSRADAGKSIGCTGDEGIDGIIKKDRLGRDVIFLQAKRWEGTVGRPEIQRRMKNIALGHGVILSRVSKYELLRNNSRILIDMHSMIAGKAKAQFIPFPIALSGKPMADILVSQNRKRQHCQNAFNQFPASLEKNCCAVDNSSCVRVADERNPM